MNKLLQDLTRHITFDPYYLTSKSNPSLSFWPRTSDSTIWPPKSQVIMTFDPIIRRWPLTWTYCPSLNICLWSYPTLWPWSLIKTDLKFNLWFWDLIQVSDESHLYLWLWPLTWTNHIYWPQFATLISNPNIWLWPQLITLNSEPSVLCWHQTCDLDPWSKQLFLA